MAISPNGIFRSPLALLAAGCLAQSGLTLQAQSYDFGPRIVMPEHPNSVLAADFNNDGIPDLASPSWSPSVVSVLLGNGSGGVGAPVVFSLPSGSGGPRFAVAADFNADGNIDVATANSESADVAILLGNGSGGLAASRRVFTGGTTPFHLAAGDLNGDGVVDLVVANSGANTITALLGTGTGDFTSAGVFSVGATPRAVALADFNGDGKLDAAVSNFGSANVSVLHGNGLGGFGAAANYAVGVNPFTLTTADVNGDGRRDLIVPNFGGANVSILLGTASGFSPGATLPAGKSPRAVIAHDLDQDGVVDLVTANYASHSATVFRGTGTGSFDVAGTYGIGTGPFYLCGVDLDGNGGLDFAVADRDGHTISLVKANGLKFVAPAGFAAGVNPRGIATADFDHDGLLDVVTANNGGANVSLLRGTATGGLAAPVNFATDSGSWGIEVADFNSDGHPDVVSANASKNNVSILRGNGAGSFAAQQKISVASGPRAVTVADFNGDGRTDIATANFNANSVSVLLATAAGSFNPAVSYPADIGSHGIGSGDLNGDGFIDLAVCNATAGTVSVLLGSGAGTFSSPANFPCGAGPVFISVRDLDGDGDLDLAVANETANTMTVLFGNGTGSFGSPATYATGTRPLSVKAGDVTADGIVDLVTANATSCSVTVHPGLGNGTFGPGISIPAGAFARAIALADFNGDGQTDICVANADDNSAWIITNRSGQEADLSVSVSNNTTIVQTGSSQSYVITVANSGPATLTSLDLDYTASAALQVTSVIPSAGSYNSGSGLWSGLNLASGQSVTLTVAGTVANGASGTLNVSATASLPIGFSDTHPANNTAQDSDTISEPPPAGVPTAIPQSYTVAEDGNVSIVLTATDPENDPITFAVTVPPTQGVLTGAAPNLVYTPNANYNGPDSFVFSASDASGTSTATISVNVQSVNDAPVASNGNAQTDEDVPVLIALNASDVDGDSLTYTIITSPTLGSLSGAGANRSYTPNLHVSGSDSFTFRVSDPSGAQSSIATVNVQIDTINDVPTVVSPIPDQSEIGPGTLITVDLTGRFDDEETPAASLVLSATSSNPGLVNPVISEAILNLNLTPGQNGSSTITVRATDQGGAWVENMFVVTVSRDGVKVSINDVASGEGGSGLIFTLSLTAASPTPVSVSYSTAPLTATAGVDYQVLSGVITFPAGTLTRTVRIPSIQDTLDEIDETFAVLLSSPVNATIEDGEGIGTILDNDTSSLTVQNMTVAEADSGVTTVVYTIAMSTPSSRTVTVDYNTVQASGGAIANVDYVPVSGTLTFPAGNNASQTVTVDVIGDTLYEASEIFNFVLSGAVNATIGRASSRTTITDNDTPPVVSISDASIVEGHSGTRALIFTVTINAQIGTRGRVQYATANGTATAGSDYTARTGEITFDPGVTSRTVSITITGERVIETDETFTVNLHSPSGLILGTATATGTIQNDD